MSHGYTNNGMDYAAALRYALQESMHHSEGGVSQLQVATTDAEIAAKDAEIAAKDAEIAALEAKLREVEQQCELASKDVMEEKKRRRTLEDVNSLLQHQVNELKKEHEALKAQRERPSEGVPPLLEAKVLSCTLEPKTEALSPEPKEAPEPELVSKVSFTLQPEPEPEPEPEC